jgi:hypothetical protein
MITPARGDYANIPINAAARTIADAWDPAKDQAAGEACKAYAAPAIMREPGRLQITWQDDNTLKIETDAGMQTRLLRFVVAGNVQPAAGEPTWQGTSVARWEAPPRGTAGNTIPLGLGARAGTDTRTLEVTTTRIRPGYLRTERRSIQRRHQRHRVLRPLQGSRWRGLVRRHDDRARSAISQWALGDDESLQEGAERREVEADAVHGPLDRSNSQRPTPNAQPLPTPNAQRGLRLGFGDWVWLGVGVWELGVGAVRALRAAEPGRGHPGSAVSPL